MRYIIALDQGTTSSRSIIFDREGRALGIAQEEFSQYYPKDGWVEHDPKEIWKSQRQTLSRVLEDCRIKGRDIEGIGLANQRETTVVWNRATGEPIYPAIVWQDQRTAGICEKLKANGEEELIREKTGLYVNAYFSATKLAWVLDFVPGARQKASNGELAFGTIDTWILWQLTKGKMHATDYSNASRTMLFNIHTMEWDKSLLRLFNIPESVLPEVHPSSHFYGTTELDGVDVPILGVAGDQQAALYGQSCLEEGMAKNTYGTGCFLLMNTGKKAVYSKNGLLTTLACCSKEKPVYALEGSIFIAGAAVQWLRDSLQVIKKSSNSEVWARKAKEEDQVYMVPSFTGLGTPYWDMNARGAIFGLTLDTGRAEIIKATLQSLAYQTKDVVTAMEMDAGITLKQLRVDGGASANNFLMQFQADILGVEVQRPKMIESTALGAAFLAGVQSGFWTESDLIGKGVGLTSFASSFSPAEIEKRYSKWKDAVRRSMGWSTGV